MKKKYIIIISTIFIVSLILTITYLLYIKSRSLEILYFGFRDEISQIKVYDTDNNETILEPTTDYTLLFYLSAYCGSCIEYLPELSLLYEIFLDENISIIILWLEEPPQMQLSKNNIPKEINYSMREKAKLTISTPTYYLLDENGVVVFTDVVASNLIDKVAEYGLFSLPTIQDRLTDHLRREYNTPEKNTFSMIYFSLDGCPDCMDVDEMLVDKKFDELFTINRIYSYRDNENVKPRDRYKIYKNVYGISWYPSFLIISDNEYSFVGQVPFIELEACLRDAYTKVQQRE